MGVIGLLLVISGKAATYLNKLQYGGDELAVQISLPNPYIIHLSIKRSGHIHRGAARLAGYASGAN